MRIVHLSGYGGPYAGSFVPMLLAVLVAARERGHDVEAVFRAEAEGGVWLQPLHDAGIPVRFLPVESRPTVARAVRLLVAERDEPTILHTHFTIFDLAAAAAARAAQRTWAFWHMHSRAEPGVLVRLRNLAKYAAIGRSVEQILCVSPDIAEAVRSRGAPGKLVRFFPNAIDTSRFPPVGEAERAAARAALGAGDRPVLLHFGWDWERKGGDLFLESSRLLLDRRRPVLALTVGGGEPAGELGRRLGLDDAVLVHQPTDDLRPLHAAADVFLSPSRAEGMPFSIAEALAIGLPVVATDIPGQRVQCEGLGACRLTGFEPSALADAVESLLGRAPEQAAADSREARRRVVEQLDLGPWAARLLELYDAAAS